MEYYFDEQGHLSGKHNTNKEYTFRFPSGHVIAIPNFHETLEHQKQDLLRRLAIVLNVPTPRMITRSNQPLPIFDEIEFFVDNGIGLPFCRVTLFDNGVMRHRNVYCNVLTGQWRLRCVEDDVLFRMVMVQDNLLLMDRLKKCESDIKMVQKENAQLKSWHAHIAERQQTWNEFNAIANEMVKEMEVEGVSNKTVGAKRQRVE